MVLADSFYYQPVQIDTINTRVNADLFAKEGDANGRGMVVQITENGIIKDTTGITLRLQWSHLSVVASGFTEFEVVDATKGLYKLQYPTSMLHRGRVEAFIRITDNGILSGTRNLLITVERMVGSDETIEAADDFSALQTALTRLSIWDTTISGKVNAWEVDMEATKQLYIDTLNATEAAYPQELVSMKQQLEQTITIVKLTDGEDGTVKIQTALDKKGLVRVYGDGAVLASRLFIGDDTTLEIMPGFILKKKDGTDHHILCNKGHLTNTRNKNITLRGGNFDLNSLGNVGAAGDMSVNPQSNPGIGIVFRGVDNLTIENIEDIGNEWKYAFLITDINKGSFQRININNESDGLHFQPPLTNITIKDISGVTQDDLISFTMGDYQRYSLGQYGNIENVIIENVHGGEGTDELIKMVGSGLDGNSVFKNIYVRNLSGYATVYPVYIMKEDQAIANPCLKDTKLENVVFENIDVKISGAQSYFAIGAVSGDVTIRKLKIKQSDSLRPILLQKCNMSKVILEDIEVVESSGTETTNYIVRVDNTSLEVLDQLILRDSNIKLNSSANISVVYPTAKSLKTLSIDNVKVNAPAATFIYTDGVNTDGTDVFINNSDINANILGSIANNVNLYVSNSKIITPLRTLHLSDGANVRVQSVGSGLDVVINGLNASRFLSLTGDLKSTVIPSTLTPLENDSYFYKSATDVRNIGVYRHNGTKWVKVNGIKDFDVTVTTGTLPAQSVTEFSVILTDVSAYAMAFANPTFALPSGIVYSFTLRSSGVGRLRLSNPTANPIAFDGATQIAWKVKTLDFDYQ